MDTTLIATTSDVMIDVTITHLAKDVVVGVRPLLRVVDAVVEGSATQRGLT
jgi:hypothetical protein